MKVILKPYKIKIELQILESVIIAYYTQNIDNTLKQWNIQFDSKAEALAYIGA